LAFRSTKAGLHRIDPSEVPHADTQNVIGGDQVRPLAEYLHQNGKVQSSHFDKRRTLSIDGFFSSGPVRSNPNSRAVSTTKSSREIATVAALSGHELTSQLLQL
jgi:hypothetical protein